MAEQCTEKDLETGSTDQRHVRERQTKARAYCGEDDSCGWTGIKPGRPDTNTSFNMPDIQRDWSNTV